MRAYAEIIKPILDVLLALIILILLSWLFAIIVLIYMMMLELPILFRQDRMGKSEKSFKMLKFRTLKVEGNNLSDRKFVLGNFLRATSLDELPQLFNVLKGDMSLIGPRPLPVEYGPLYSSDQRKRFAVKPGITGWTQVNGRHGIPWTRKFELDNYYVAHQSFGLDIKILFKTLVLLLSINKDISLHEKPFTGSN